MREMSPLIKPIATKICGIKTLEAAVAAIGGGARFLGFIHFAKSPRHLEVPAIGALIADIRATNKNVKTVCVVVDPDDRLLTAIGNDVRPDYIQLHGHETPERVEAIAKMTDIPLIKAISIRVADDLMSVSDYAPSVEYLLYDAKPPKGSVLPGGMGLSFDWHLLEGHVAPKPYFLAGGIHVGNIAEAIHITGARHIDISSGVESQPGEKDVNLISGFLNVVKTL